MHTTSGRVRAVLGSLAVVLVVAAGGCSADRPSPAPEPEPESLYEPVPGDWCSYLEVEELAARYDLVLPTRFDSHESYTAERGIWYASCWFAGEAPDGRFKTELPHEFKPSGPVSVEVRRDTNRA